MAQHRSRRGRRGGQGPLVNGFLVVDKPVGSTSMDVVRTIKRLTGMRKRVGHGGTLDPLASGLLPICFGQATRLMEHLINETKGYRMDVRLGVSTDTYDAEGQVVEERDPSDITREQVEEALDAFRGSILQKPPMHSALKKGGKRLYELARQGVEVEREARQVEVYTLDLLEFKPPIVTLESECGRGVYMRSLAHDLGEMLGCGAHTASLVRLRTGGFLIEDAVTLDEFAKAVEEKRWKEMILPLDFPPPQHEGSVRWRRRRADAQKRPPRILGTSGPLRRPPGKLPAVRPRRTVSGRGPVRPLCQPMEPVQGLPPPRTLAPRSPLLDSSSLFPSG